MASEADTQKKSYKQTLNLPQTAFAMEAKLVANEPKRLQMWKEGRLYERILGARAGSLPEVLGDAAHFVDPQDEEALAAGLGRIVEDAALRATLAARGPVRAARFRWDGAASAMRQVYEEARA